LPDLGRDDSAIDDSGDNVANCVVGDCAHRARTSPRGLARRLQDESYIVLCMDQESERCG